MCSEEPGADREGLCPPPQPALSVAFTAGRAFFPWCVKRHLIVRSPIENMGVPNGEQSHDRVLSENELRCLLQALRTNETPFKRLWPASAANRPESRRDGG